MKLLRTNKLEGIKHLSRFIYRYGYEWDAKVDWEVYKYLIDTPHSDRNTREETIIIMKSCHIDELDKYNYLFLHMARFDFDILNYIAATNMDLERYKKIIKLTDRLGKFEVYINDSLPQNFKDELDFQLLCHFGCINLLKGLNLENMVIKEGMEWISKYPAKVPRTRARETFNYLKELHINPGNLLLIIEEYLNYWSWILDHKPYPRLDIQDFMFGIQGLNPTILGNLKLMIGFVKYGIFDFVRTDIFNYPELIEYIVEHSRQLRTPPNLNANWDPILYVALFDKVSDFDKITLVPDADILGKFYSKLKNIPFKPEFLEPLEYWKVHKQQEIKKLKEGH